VGKADKNKVEKNMMRIVLITVTAVLVSFPALAQQPDPAFLQRAVQALQAQRNAALDAEAISEAKALGLTEDLNKANLRIKGFEDKEKDSKSDAPKADESDKK
jgi:hypothetical protein